MWPVNIDTYSISLRRGGVQIFISGLGCDTLWHSHAQSIQIGKRAWSNVEVLSFVPEAVEYVLANPPCEQWESLDFTSAQTLSEGVEMLMENFQGS